MLAFSRQRGTLAELLVAYRFFEAGRLVSWPLTPCAYDLVVDSGDRLWRVQVKQAFRSADRNAWTVRLTKRNTKGDKVVACQDLDLVVVVTTADVAYVIPVPACASPTDGRYLNARIEVSETGRYAIFRNRYAVGTGLTDEIAPVAVTPTHPGANWAPSRRLSGPRRKAHRRLTAAEVLELRQLPIRWYKRQPGDGLIPLVDIARQFDVCPGTLRNVVLGGKRLDLQRGGGI